MSKHIAKNRIWPGIAALTILVTLVSGLMIIGGVRAALDIKAGDTVNVTFTAGSGTVGVSAPASVELTVNSSECLVLPEARPAVSGGADGETYVSGGKHYSFTGWKIVDDAVTEKIPGTTVFQPGDTITFDVLEDYLSATGTDNNYNLTLEALWGQCYFVENGASDSNSGLTPDAAVATLDKAFELIRGTKGESADAYDAVVMLAGDLDYIKLNSSSKYFGYATDPADPVFTSATFKSLGDTAYNFSYKPKGTGEADTVIFGNIRYDNINFLCAENLHEDYYQKITDADYRNTTHFGEAIGNIYMLNAVTDHTYYVDFTARMNQSVPAYRDHFIKYLRLSTTDYAVVNGGVYTEISTRRSGSDTVAHDQIWRLGRSVYVTDGIYGGCSYGSVNRLGNMDIYFTGGKTPQFAAAGYARYTQVATLVGDRNTYFLGQETSAEGSYTITAKVLSEDVLTDSVTTYKYDPNIPATGRFHGGARIGNTAESRITGKVNAVLRNATVNTLFYGVSDGSNSHLDGDVSIELYNVVAPNVSNNHVWCGGNTFVTGNIDVAIGGDKTTLNNVYGGTRSYGGVTGNVTFDISGAKKITQLFCGSHTAATYIDGNVTTVISGGTLGTVYGGGAAAPVTGSVEMTMTGGTADRLYGGASGSNNTSTDGAIAQNVTLNIGGNAKIGNAYGGGRYKSSVVSGTIDVNVSGGEVTGVLYTGGDASSYAGTPDLDITGGKVNAAYGGCYSGALTDDSDVSISGGTVETVYGGCNSGTVTGNTNVNITGGEVGVVYGGCNSGAVQGNAITNVQNATKMETIYGAGNTGTVYGNVELAVDNVSYIGGDHCHIWGAGQQGGVRKDGEGNGGNVNITVSNISESAKLNSIYGGARAPLNGNASVVEGLVTINVTDSHGKNVYGGGLTGSIVNAAIVNYGEGNTFERVFGSSSGSIQGDVVINANGGLITSDLCGGIRENKDDEWPDTIGGNATLNLQGVTVEGNVIGGCFASGSIGGQITINGYEGSTVTANLFGGGWSMDYAGTPDINIFGGTYRYIFGGGNDADVAATDVDVTGGDILMVFGGGNGNSNVTGNTDVRIDGTQPHSAAIKVRNVYGGGYSVNADVGGNTNVEIVDVSEAEKKIALGDYSDAELGNTLVERFVVFGGGCYGAVGGDAHLTLTDCVVGGGTQPVSVYGGGYHEEATVGGTNNLLTNVTILDTDVEDGTGSNYYGGGHFANVLGDVSTTLLGNCSFDATYYGGGYYGTAVNVTNRIGGNTVLNRDYFGAGRIKDESYDASVQSVHTVFDGTDIQVKGETYSAGYLATTGDALLEVKNGTFGTAEGDGNIYGSAEAGAVTGTATTLLEGNGAVKLFRSLYGGGRYEEATTGNTVITVSNPNALINHYFFGGGADATVTGDVTVNFSAGTVRYDLHGGSSTGVVGTDGEDTKVTVHISGGTIRHIFGGGRGSDDKAGDSPVYSDIFLTVRPAGAEPLSYSTIYGGGNSAKAMVYGNILNTIEDVIVPRFCGGGLSGSVYGNITNNVTNLNPRAHFTNETAYPVTDTDKRYFGGCYNGSVHGNITNNVSGTLRGETVSYIYEYAGGTYGSDSVVYGDIVNNLTGQMGMSAIGARQVSGLIVAKNYYGGSINGAINGNITNNVTDLDMRQLYSATGGVQGTFFYGGSYSGVINGNVTSNLQGTDPALRMQLRTTYGGNAYKTINGITYLNILDNVYTGDNCVAGSRYENSTVWSSYATVNGANTSLNLVYGGSHVGQVVGNEEAGVPADTHVTFLNGTANGVYGGSVDDAATVYGNSYAVIGEKNVDSQILIKNYALGGGNSAPTMGTSTVKMYSGQVNGIVYGGGNAQTATVAETYVYLVGGSVAGKVFGGGNNAPVGITNLYEIGTTVGGDMYGGGSKAPATVNTTNVTVIGGDMKSVFGGGDAAPVVDDPRTKAVEGNTNLRIEGNSAYEVAVGEDLYHPSTMLMTAIYGGGNTAVVEGNTNVVIHDESGTDPSVCKIQIRPGSYYYVCSIFGGGYGAPVNGTANLLMENCCLGESIDEKDGVYIFGGGNIAKATVGYANTVMRDMTYVKNSGRTFSGGRKGSVLNDCSYTMEGVTNHNGTLFGGCESGTVGGTATVYVLDNSHLEESLYGGGRYKGAYTGNTHIIVDAKDEVLPAGKNYTFSHTVYGGGTVADVKGNTLVEFKNGSIARSVFAGGSDAHVGGTATVIVSGDSFINENVFGGGYGPSQQADVQNTVVKITENAYIKGSVYGGGDGLKTVVHGTTDVTIDLNHGFTVSETVTDTANPTSGKTGVEITADAGTAGTIGGSVYGGGNRGAVGAGTVIVGTNNAALHEVGKTKVTVKNGVINGSVFGGGRGQPTTKEPYQIAMGAVFGSTETDIFGGYIAGKGGVGGVYGGGEKSRVYAESGQKATVVNVDSTVADTDIAIYGSVFGGGDRGEDDMMNTSIPTTVGDVEVNIIGETTAENRTVPTQIYLKNGGLYGDGNLCKTEGNRVINVKDFGTGIEPRADATSLKTLYSIQRADVVNLINSDVVLIGTEDAMDSSDYEQYSISRVGALHMQEGSTVKLDSVVKFLGELHSDYQPDRTFIDKGFNNVNNQYEGHGGQLANVQKLSDEETATYIANDVGLANNHTDYNTVCVANGRYLTVADETGAYGPVTGLYTLELLNAVPGEGGGFVYGDITSSTGDFICTTTYASATNTDDAYMDVIDNVGKLMGEENYSYYYWYISGDRVNYDLSIDGYIGINKIDYSDRVAFAYASDTVAGNEQPLHYVLDTVTVNEELLALLEQGYTLETSAADVSSAVGEAIAVEFRLAGESLGFLTKSGEKWGLNQSGSVKTGLEGVQVEDAAASQISGNSLLYKKIDGTNNDLEVILYRSAEVDDWVDELGVTVTLKLFQETNAETYQPVENGAHIHVINAEMALRRMVPTQSIYAENRRNYVGVAGLTELHVNEHSSVSLEVQTNYIPSAFPNEGGAAIVNSLNVADLPNGTKISMVDLTGDIPTFYYYIKQSGETAVALDQFMQMGTELRIADLPADAAPAYVQAYLGQSSEVVNERLLFVLDFEQVPESHWAGVDPTVGQRGTVLLNHFYNGKDIMDYTKENGEISEPSSLSYSVHPTVEGLDVFTMSFEVTDAEEGDAGTAQFPSRGVSQFNVELTESIVAVDTRYYEGEFGIKLQMYLDDSDTPVKLPDGITFECNGETYYPDATNNFAVVGVDGFGSHRVTMNTDLFGITGVSGKVTLKATVYSAPEPVYYNHIETPRTGEASFIIGDEDERHLLVHCENLPTNLLLEKSEPLSFALTTKQIGDEEAIVYVEAYRKVGDQYTEAVDMGTLFKEGRIALGQTDGVPVDYHWLLADDAPAGTYRLVFTFGERIEYLYFIIN